MIFIPTIITLIINNFLIIILHYSHLLPLLYLITQRLLLPSPPLRHPRRVAHHRVNLHLLPLPHLAFCWSLPKYEYLLLRHYCL